MKTNIIMKTKNRLEACHVGQLREVYMAGYTSHLVILLDFFDI